ncbi:MAG: ArsR family transcriptional regulator [Candidatus Hermodarchaeota archaeon]
MEEYSDLLSELSHPIRIKILSLLVEKKLSFSKIMENLEDNSKSEVSRHLSRLMEHGFIQKELPVGRKYEITPFGLISIKIFKPIDFIFRHSSFFKNHDITFLPNFLIRELDSLKSCQFMKGLGSIMTKIQDFLSISVDEMWMMTDARFPFKWDAKKMNFLIPSEMLKLKDMALEHHIETKFKVGILRNVSTALVINSLRQGLLFFPKIGEYKPDYSECIIINDEKGIEFLKQIWNYFWENSELFNNV